MSWTVEVYLELRVAELMAARWPGLVERVCHAVDAEQALVVGAELERRANAAVAAVVIPRSSSRVEVRRPAPAAGVGRRVDLQPPVS
jgi:hypothetical protein